MARRFTSSRMRLQDGESVDTMPIYAANSLIIYASDDFEYWIGEQVKRAATDRHRTMGTTEWSIEHNVLDRVERMEEICKALRAQADLVLAVERQREQIRHLREDNDGFSEFEIKQRQRKANELEAGKLVELEAALTEALR